MGGALPAAAPVCDVAHILSSIRSLRGPFNLRDETSPATIASEKAAILRETAANTQLLSSSGAGSMLVVAEEEEGSTATGSPWWVRPPSASQSALLHYSHLRKYPKKPTTTDGSAGGSATFELSSFISSGPSSLVPGSPVGSNSPNAFRVGGVTSSSGHTHQIVAVPIVHTPNWRALLYSDVYKSEDEQKEALAKKYEALLGAQKKLFPQFGGPPARGGNADGGATRTPSNTPPRKPSSKNTHNKSSSSVGQTGKKKGGSRGGLELRSPGKYLRETGKATAPDKLATTAQIQSARNTMLNARAYFCGRTARSRENAAAGTGGGTTSVSPRSGPLLGGVIPPKSPDDIGTLGGNGAVVPFGKHVLPLLAGRSAGASTTATTKHR